MPSKPVRGSSTKKQPRTRGGWVPAGTAAARRASPEEHKTARGKRTREEIVAAARTIFERNGYFDARVADIVAKADVSHGSFYTYFSSKQEVFRAVARKVGEQFQDAVTSAPGDHNVDAYAALDHSNRRYLDAYRANSVIWALVEQVSTVDPDIHRFRLAGRQRHIERITKTIIRWQERGLADPAIDPHTTAGALASMLSNFAYWWLAGGDTYDDELAAQTLTDIWAKAVGLRRRPRRSTAKP